MREREREREALQLLYAVALQGYLSRVNTALKSEMLFFDALGGSQTGIKD